MHRRSTLAGIAGAAFMIAASLQPVARAQTPAPSMPGHKAGSPAQPGGGMDMMSAMKDMNARMTSMPMTGDHDVDFAMMMRVHHEGAIRMAEAELRHGKNAEMKKMGRNIISAQKKEIAQIDRFLAKKGHPAPKN